MEPVGTERSGAVLGGEGRETNAGDQHVDGDDERDRTEEAPRQIATRPACLLRVVRNRLEPRVGEHRKWDREGDVVPRRMDADRDAASQRIRREQEDEAGHDE